MTYRKQAVSLHLLLILLIFLITIFVFYRAMMHLRVQLDEMRINSVHQVQQVGRDYDMILQSNEKLLAETLREAMNKMHDRLKNKDTKIWEVAKENGLDRAIITDMRGNVLSSAHPNIHNNPITERIPEYVEFVQKPENQNRLIIDRLGLLFDRDRLYKAAWYIDSQEGNVLIAAIDFQSWLERENGISFSNYLLSDYFNSMSNTVMLVKNVSLYYEQGAEVYTEGGLENLDISDLTAYAYESIESQVFNNKDSIVIPYRLAGMSELNRLWLKIHFDMNKIRQLSTNLLLRTLLSFVILVLVIYLAVFFFYRNLLEIRKKWILDLVKAVKNNSLDENTIEKGIFDKEIEDAVFDLTSHFSEHYEKTREEIASKNEAVGSLRRQLDNERVREASLKKQMKSLEQSCEQLQRYDSITGLPNRESMREFIHYERERSERTEKEFSLLILDIANLKELLEKYGKDMGSYLINKVGSKLLTLLRKQDKIGRWNETQFMMLLPMTNSDGLYRVIARIEQMLEEAEFFWEERRLEIEKLCGASVYRKGTLSEAMIKQTEVAVLDAVNKKQDVIIS